MPPVEGNGAAMNTVDTATKGISTGRLSRRSALGVLGGAALAGASLTLASCGRGGAASRQPASSGGQSKPQLGGQVRTRLTVDPNDWDVSLLGKGGADGIFLAYDNLVGFRAGQDVGYTDAVIAPELAESWEIGKDATTFTFHLRKGVKFADLPPVNGRELTAADVKWSYEYWTRTGQFAGKKLRPAQWAWMFEGMDRVETPDPYTAVVYFKKPFVPFASYAAAERGSPIVPHEIYDQDGNLSNRIVGTGAFQLDVTATQKGTRWVWKRNPTYWQQGKPYIDSVQQLIVPDDSAAFAAFQTKQLDILGDLGNGWNISYQDGQRLQEQNPHAGVQEAMHPKPLLLYINVQREPFSDLRVRQALSLAIDRDEFVKTFTGGKGGWALCGAIAGLFTQAETKAMLHYDPAQAKQLVAQAGYPNGADVEFIYPGKLYGDLYISEMELLQSQLKKAGINLSLKNVEATAFGQRKKSHDFQLTITPGSTIDGDVDAWVYGDFYPGSTKNYNNVNDPALGKMLDQQRAEVDQSKRKTLLRDIVRYINVEKVWGLSVFYGVDWTFWQPEVKNFYPNFWTHRWNGVNRWMATSA